MAHKIQYDKINWMAQNGTFKRCHNFRRPAKRKKVPRVYLTVSREGDQTNLGCQFIPE